MFKMSLTTTSMQVPKTAINLSANANVSISQKDTQGQFSFNYQSARSMAQMGMNIANLKASRGCSSCGK
jgi:hypothetical protein